MKKACLTMLALVLCLGMVSAVPNAWASSYDPAPPFVKQRALNQNRLLQMNQGGVGDALVGPMYRATVPGSIDEFNFVTYVSIENTSDRWVAAHVRLRSGRYSIEIKDFPILLSPHDVFWFQFQLVPDAMGSIQSVDIFSRDTNTLQHSGLPVDDNGNWRISLDASLLNKFDIVKAKYYPTQQDALMEMTQGYVEVFGLWSMNLPANFAGTFYQVMSGLWNCSQASAKAAGGINYLGAVAQDVRKDLTGHVFMGDFTNGLYFGYPLTALENFRTRMTGQDENEGSFPIHRDMYIRGSVNGAGSVYNPALIIYNYGSDAAYTNPDWATSFGPTWNDGDDITTMNRATQHFGPGGAVDSWSLDEVDDALVKQRVMSTYFNGGFSGETYTLAAVTFPTKYLHYFFDLFSGLVDRENVVPLGLSNTAPRFIWPVGNLPGNTNAANSIRKYLDVDRWIGTVGFSASGFDSAEHSPAQLSPFRDTVFDWEVNFIGIGDLSIARMAPFCFLNNNDPDSTFNLLTNAGGYNTGWFWMEGFSLGGGIVSGDPRTSEFGLGGLGAYSRPASPLLDELNEHYGYSDIIPVLVYMMDWEFTNSSHARAFEANWDNMTNWNNMMPQ